MNTRKCITSCFEPELYEALRLRAAADDGSISNLVKTRSEHSSRRI